MVVNTDSETAAKNKQKNQQQKNKTNYLVSDLPPALINTIL